MTLSYQLTRGCLALALLGALAVAAWAAPGEPPPADVQIVGVRLAAAVPAAPVRAACPLPAPGLRLALAPTDLRVLGRRAAPDCRA